MQPQLFRRVGSPARFAARLRKYLRGETAGGVARGEQYAAGMEGKSCLNWLWPCCWSVSSYVFGANGGANFIEILIAAMGKLTSLSQAHNRKKPYTVLGMNIHLRYLLLNISAFCVSF